MLGVRGVIALGMCVVAAWGLAIAALRGLSEPHLADILWFLQVAVTGFFGAKAVERSVEHVSKRTTAAEAKHREQLAAIQAAGKETLADLDVIDAIAKRKEG